MRFQRRGGRKRIVAPDGISIAPATKPQPDGTLVKALARAWRWQRMLENSEYGTLAELAHAERISRASAASCGSRSSPLISSNESSTAGRRQGSRSS